jgi:ATP-dependent DNA helicase PIF1
MGTSSQGAVIDLEPRHVHSTPQLRRPRYYAVAIGLITGVFSSYEAAAPHIAGHPYGRWRKFSNNDEAQAYVDKYKHRQGRYGRSEASGTAAKDLDLPAYDEYRQTVRASYPHQETNGHAISLPPVQPEHGSRPPHTAQSVPEPDLETAPGDHTKAPIDTGPPLVPEQQNVVDLILSGRNVFYTGSAGCGKSTVLKASVRQLQALGKRVRIVAPTNLAALNVGGITTWSYAGWTVNSMKKDIDKLMQSAFGDKSWDRFDETDVLVIDEISMIENLFFERLNMVIKAARGEKYGGGPFGGMQVIVTGDVSSTVRS